MPAAYLIFAGDLEPYVYTDVPVSRSRAIEMIASGEPENMHSVMGFDLESGRAWDATAEVMTLVLEKLADEGEPLSRSLWETIELHAGHRVAREFRMEDA